MTEANEARPPREAGGDGRAPALARRRAIIFFAGGAALLLIMIFARIMNYDLRRDEQIYVPPALLLSDFDLYEDIFFNHTPASAWLFRAAKILTGSESLLFPARLVVFAAWAGLAAAVAGVSWRLTASAGMTAFLFLAVMTNDAFLSVTGMAATNNFLPLPLIYLGAGLFFIGVGGSRPSPWLFLASGVLLGLAGSIKISAALAGPVLFGAALFLPRGVSFAARMRDVAGPLAVGGLIGAAPILVYLKNAPDKFLAHVVDWHIGPHADFWRSQPPEPLEAAMALPGKAALGYIVWSVGANAIMIAAFLTLVFILAARRGAAKALDARILACAALFAVLALGSFLPTPSFPQYFSPPIVVAPLLLALLYARLDGAERARAGAALAAMSVVLVVMNLPRLTMDLARLPFPERWETAKVHRDGLAVADAMAAAGASGKVATLAPLYPLEGGLAVYRELATGPFAYRAAPFTPPALAERLVLIGPHEIEAFLEADPPGALLLGFMPEFEGPFLRFADRHGYRALEGFSIKGRDCSCKLYVRASAAGAT